MSTGLAGVWAPYTPFDQGWRVDAGDERVTWIDQTGAIRLQNAPKIGVGLWRGYRESDHTLVDTVVSSATLVGEAEWEPSEWPRLSRVEANVSSLGGYVHFDCAVVDDVDVAVTDAGTEVRAVNCVLRQTRVAGRLGTLWVEIRDPALVAAGRAALFGAADASWWLDISELEATDLVLRGVEPSRVVIDPTRQAFVSSEQLIAARDRFVGVDLPGVAGDQIERTLRGGHNAMFINVPRRRRTAAAERELLGWLREQDLTLPSWSDVHPTTSTPPTGASDQDPADGPASQDHIAPAGGIGSVWFLAVDRLDALDCLAHGSWGDPDRRWQDDAPVAGLADLAAAITDLTRQPLSVDIDEMLISTDEPVAFELPDELVHAVAALGDDHIQHITANWDGDPFAGTGDLSGCRDLARTATATGQHIYGVLEL